MSVQELILQSLAGLAGDGVFESAQGKGHFIDLIETEDKITLYMDIPGVANDSIDVNFFNNRVEISGERVSPYSPDDLTGNRNRRELTYGNFCRKVILPISVTNRESVNISSNQGVLKVEIDKSSEERNRFNLRLV